MAIMVRDKKFYKRLALIAAPLALQNVISLSVNLADNVMVGTLGENAISGIYLANRVQTFFQMLVMGLGAAMTILATQYWGKRDRDSVVSIISIAIKFSTAVAFAMFLVMLLFPAQVLGLFVSDNPGAIAEGVAYVRIIAFTYLFFCFTNVMLSAFRSVEVVHIGMILSSITLVINVSLNALFIFGLNMGVRGAALATLISRIVESGYILYYAKRVDQKLMLRFSELLKPINRILMKDFFRYGLPVVAGDVIWGLNMVVQGVIIGHMGNVVTASASIADAVASIVNVGVYSLANATAVIIGQTVGRGDFDLAKQYTKTLQVLFLGMGILSGTLLFLVKDWIILLYNVEPETVATAMQFMTVLAVTTVGTAYQMSVLTGIVRAGGATHFVLVNDTIFVWLVVIPSALIARFFFQAPDWVVFACLKCDQILKCAVAVVTVNRYKWIKKLTREDLSPEGA